MYKRKLEYKTYFCDLQDTLHIEERICSIYKEKSINKCKKDCKIKKYKAVLEFYHENICRISNICCVRKYSTTSILYKCKYFNEGGFCTNMHYNQIEIFGSGKIELPSLFFCGNGYIKKHYKVGV